MKKIIDINEFIKWCLSYSKSQSKINTINKYWNCETKEDYLKIYKDKIKKEQEFWWKKRTYDPDKWIEYQYCWDLDRLFDIYKFVDDCPRLAKVNIGYDVFNKALRSKEWKDYIEIIKVYNKPHIAYHEGENDFECTFRIVKMDFGEFQVYARQSRALSAEHAFCAGSYIEDLSTVDVETPAEVEKGYHISWYDEQVIFMSVPEIRINKALLKNNEIKLQKNKRLYIFSKGQGWRATDQNYRLPELYYPECMREFLRYCYEKDLLDAPSSISLWCKNDNSCIWSEKEAKHWGKWYTPEYVITNHPFPVKNIKTEKELDDYIQERKDLKVIELSEHLSKHAVAVYNKDVLFPVINSITQEVCNDFIKDYNSRKLYEIVK